MEIVGIPVIGANACSVVGGVSLRRCSKAAAEEPEAAAAEEPAVEGAKVAQQPEAAADLHPTSAVQPVLAASAVVAEETAAAAEEQESQVQESPKKVCGSILLAGSLLSSLPQERQCAQIC